MAEIILYASIASRSIAAWWILEELGVPYTWVDTDLLEGKQKRPEYLAINPDARVPAIKIDGVVVTERPAIIALLADRFGYGALAPKIEDPRRGPYLKWLTYATGVLDPAIAVHLTGLKEPLNEQTWDGIEHVETRIADTLTAPGPWLLGEQFTAADVMIGAIVVASVFNKLIPENAMIWDYSRRIMERPAFQRAADFTWPPDKFPRG
jgi:glutathione S-transferase